MSYQPITDMVLMPNTKGSPLFPVKHEAIWRFYKEVSSQFWTIEDISAESDKDARDHGSVDELKKAVLLCIDLLTYSHKQMHTALLELVQTQITTPEARCFFEYQNMIENTHAEALDTVRCDLLKDVDTNLPQFSRSESFVEGLLKEKMEWSVRQIVINSSIYDRLVALVASQRVFSASLYAILQWIVDGKDVRLPGLLKTLFLVGRDIDSHVDFATLIFHYLENKPSRERAVRIVKEVVGIEQRFASELLSTVEVDPEALWITKESMREYIQFLGKTVLESMQYRVWTLTDNPYPWMLHAEGEVVLHKVLEMLHDEQTKEKADPEDGRRSRADRLGVVLVEDSDEEDNEDPM